MPTPLDCSPASLRRLRNDAREAGGFSVEMQHIDGELLRALGDDGLEAFDAATGYVYLNEPACGYEATEEEYSACLLAWAQHRNAQHHALVQFSEGVSHHAD